MSLLSILSTPNLTPITLFSHKNISTQIKNSISNFIEYSRRHRPFIHECIKISLNSSYEQLQQNNLQQISYQINQIFTCDQEQISDLFFYPQKKQNHSRKASDQISQKLDGQLEEDVIDNIQTEAERLFQSQEDIHQNHGNSNNNQGNINNNINTNNKNNKQPFDGPIEIQKDELAKLTLDILRTPSTINQSSLGYLSKIWSFLIRNNSNQCLQFFSQNLQYYQLLLSNLQFSSISNLLSQLLVCQDKSRIYQYKSFKSSIFSQLFELMFRQQNLSNEQFYDGIMILWQQIINNSKQTYYEYFQDFKDIVNIIVSKQIMQKFCYIVKNGKEIQVMNALKYLQLVFERINGEKEEGDTYGRNSYYSQNNNNNNNKQPTMMFEIQCFIGSFKQLAQKICSYQFQNYKITTKIQYITFIHEILKTPQMTKNNNQIDFVQILSILLKTFNTTNQPKITGIYKTKFFHLIQSMIPLCQPASLSKLIFSPITQPQSSQSPSQPSQQFLNFTFPILKTINFDNRLHYNRNQNIAFECKILFDLNMKIQNLIQKVSIVYKKNIKKVKDHYQTKIANFGKNIQKNISLEEEGFFNFNQSFQNLKISTNSNRQNNNNNNNSSSSNQQNTFSLSFSFNNNININNNNNNLSQSSLSSNIVGKNNISIPLLNLSLSSSEKPLKQSSFSSSITSDRHQHQQQQQSQQQQQITQQIQQVIKLDPIKLQNNQFKLLIKQNIKQLEIVNNNKDINKINKINKINDKNTENSQNDDTEIKKENIMKNNSNQINNKTDIYQKDKEKIKYFIKHTILMF